MSSVIDASAIVVGAGINGLGVVRSLGREGVAVVVVERTPGGPACESKYSEPHLYGPLVSGARDDFVGYIVQVARRFSVPPTLFLTQESVVAIVSQQRDRLSEHVRHVLADHKVLSGLMDKTAFQAQAQALGLPVPACAVVDKVGDVEVARALTYPCVLKPVSKSERWEQRNKKAYRFESFDQLSEVYPRLHADGIPVIVQEWIEGTDADVYFTLVYRDASGATLGSFTGRKLRQWPPLVGGTASCMPAPEAHAELLDLTTRFFDAVGFVGMGSMEFKRDRRSNRFVMVEPTVGRTDYQQEVATLNGVNLPYIAHCSLLGRPLPSSGKKPVQVCIWRDSESDLRSQNALASALPVEARNAQVVDALFRFEDPGPYMKQLRERGGRKMTTLVRRARAQLGEMKADLFLPGLAKRVRNQDRKGLPDKDPGSEAVIEACLSWLCRAQDMSASGDGGFARDYSLIKRWAPSYPETSGYIVPTLIEASRRKGRQDLLERARRSLDWLVSIQFPEGGFQGGMIGQTPRVPVTFNTGQILLGLAAGAAHLNRDRYIEPMRKAAQWLADSQDADGCWRRFATPFAAPGEKTYETHVAWGLFEAARVLPDQGFGEAGMRQVIWALTNQQPNGWFRSNCLGDPSKPLTHTIGYALRGLVEAHAWSGEPEVLEAACKTADGVCSAVDAKGFLPGRLDSNWNGQVTWSCLTGSSQIAHSLFLLATLAQRPHYAAKARLLTAYVRRTVRVDGDSDVRGGIRGSFPIDGEYGRFQYLNWACKFTIDALWAEQNYSGTSR